MNDENKKKYECIIYMMKITITQIKLKVRGSLRSEDININFMSIYDMLQITKISDCKINFTIFNLQDFNKNVILFYVFLPIIYNGIAPVNRLPVAWDFLTTLDASTITMTNATANRHANTAMVVTNGLSDCGDGIG